MHKYPHQTSLQHLVMEDEMGVNAPIMHQSVIARLTAGLYPLFRSGTILFEPLPETMLGEETSPTPDLILYDAATHTTKVIIEICAYRGEKNDLKKVVWLIEENEYGVVEGFLFNYMSKTWLRYKKGDGGAAISSSFSDVLNLDLNSFL
jgi:hypothetical protein